MSNQDFDAQPRVSGRARPALSVRPVYADNGFNPPRPVSIALQRGWCGRCPACGGGPVVTGYAELEEACPSCGAALHHGRVGNAIALFVGPVALALALLVAGVMEEVGGIPLLLELAISEAMALATALALLPRAKGLLVAYAWSRHVGGFDPLLNAEPDLEPGPRLARAGKVR